MRRSRSASFRSTRSSSRSRTEIAAARSRSARFRSSRSASPRRSCWSRSTTRFATGPRMYTLFAESNTGNTISVVGWPRRAVLVVAAVALVGAAVAAGGSVIATPISSDPYTNPTSQHRTQVEPDSFGHGDTVVAAFQTGRFNAGGGASNIGWATTTNAGRSWTTGVLPATTVYEGGPWPRISDPAVAYDPLHD